MANLEKEPVDLDFLETARHRQTFEVIIDAPIAEVFSAFAARPETWHRWFPLAGETCRWITPPPHGVGSERVFSAGGQSFQERIIAWDEPNRWAFYVSHGNVPTTAMAEDYRFDTVDGKTRFRWTIAFADSLVMRLMLPIAGRLVLWRAGPRLERELARQRGE